jgi:hypothetical protein
MFVICDEGNFIFARRLNRAYGDDLPADCIGLTGQLGAEPPG